MAILLKRMTETGAIITPYTPAVPARVEPEPAPALPHNLFSKALPEVVEHAKKVVNAELELLAQFHDKPPALVHNLFADEPPESEPQPAPTVEPMGEHAEHSILEALTEFAEKKHPKKTLHIIHRTMPSHRYRVREFDPSSGRAKLEGGFKGGTLKPVITERESGLYYAVWV